MLQKVAARGNNTSASAMAVDRHRRVNWHLELVRPGDAFLQLGRPGAACIEIGTHLSQKLLPRLKIIVSVCGGGKMSR